MGPRLSFARNSVAGSSASAMVPHPRLAAVVVVVVAVAVVVAVVVGYHIRLVVANDSNTMDDE